MAEMSFDEVCLGPYMPSFDEFYDLYAKKKSGKAARKAWDKLSFIEHNLIMIHLPERLLTDELWLKGFQPYPASFLNGEMWEDEYEKRGRDNEPSLSQRLADTTW